MNTSIENVQFAGKVCNKYGLTFVPFFEVGGKYDFLTKEITIDPSSNNFKAILFHEIGHHVTMVKIGNLHPMNNRIFNLSWVKEHKELSIYYMSNFNMLNLIKAEALASRFAMKFLKDNESKKFLIEQFRTYSDYAKYLVNSVHIDECNEYCIKMEKMITNY